MSIAFAVYAIVVTGTGGTDTPVRVCAGLQKLGLVFSGRLSVCLQKELVATGDEQDGGAFSSPLLALERRSVRGWAVCICERVGVWKGIEGLPDCRHC